MLSLNRGSIVFVMLDVSVGFGCRSQPIALIHAISPDNPHCQWADLLGAKLAKSVLGMLEFSVDFSCRNGALIHMMSPDKSSKFIAKIATCHERECHRWSIYGSSLNPQHRRLARWLATNFSKRPNVLMFSVLPQRSFWNAGNGGMERPVAHIV